MSTDPLHPQPQTESVPAATETAAEARPETATGTGARSETAAEARPETAVAENSAEQSRPGWLTRIGADWAAVIVAAALVLLAVVGVLPTIPFLVR